MKGDVFDDQGNMLDSVSIHMRNLNTNQVHTIEVKEGKYVSAITLGDKDDVIITFNKDGFAFNSHYVSFDDTSFSTPSKLNVHIDKLEEGRLPKSIMEEGILKKHKWFNSLKVFFSKILL